MIIVPAAGVGTAAPTMAPIGEDESEEEMCIVHGDIEDEVSTILLAQVGQSSKPYRREF